MDLLKNTTAQLLLSLSIASLAAVLGVRLFRKMNPSQGKPSAPLPRATPAATYPPFSMPPEVLASDLLAHVPSACQLFNENLRHHTFAVIRLDNESVEMLSALEDAGRRYFALPTETKLRNREFGMGNNNIGYVNVAKVREYMKLRITDDAKLWPTEPSDFREKFLRSFNMMHDLAWACFTELGNAPADNGRPLLPATTIAAVEEFAKKKSNISLIHYYPQEESCEKMACGEHKDTGLITLLVTSNIAGLQIFDKVSHTWQQLEDKLGAHRVVVMIGEKIPQFSGSEHFTGTLHRVVLPPKIERSSMAFLLDVAK